jgi:hypothetical protein
MRQHRRYARLAQRYDPEVFRRVVRAENLVSARLDPGFALRIDSEGLLDLVFTDGRDFVVVPFVVVQAVMLLVRERSPYIWPSWLPPLRDDVVCDIEARIDPWTSSLILARFANEEAVRLFGDDAGAHALVERARERGFLGAAKTERVMHAVAPYVYAMRFAKGRSVCVRDRDGASGAALLARDAACVDVDLGDMEAMADAARWFGLECFSPESKTAARCDMSIGARGVLPDAPVRILLDSRAEGGERAVQIATAMPPAVTVSFDPGDSEPSGEFAVAAPASMVRAGGVPIPQVVAGSAGRIALVVRGDYLGNDDADIDEARSLEARLNEQGFSAALIPGTHLRPNEFDLLHVCGRRAIADTVAALERHLGQVPPMVATLYLDDAAGEAAWGAAVHTSTITNASDDVLREAYFEAIERRALDAPGAPMRGDSAPGDALLAALLRRVGAVVVSSAEEERRLREVFGFAGAVRPVPAVLAADLVAEETGAIAGLDDFVFVHAPLEPRCNQFAVVRAAAELGYPIVLCGSVQDVGYYGEVIGILPGSGMWLSGDQLTPGQLASLYRRARVFVDASWSSAGLSRLVRAAASGAALVAPTSGFARDVWPGLAVTVDPASLGGIRQGLQAAWDRAPAIAPMTAARTLEVADPLKSLVGVLGAYQLAAQAVSSQT